MELFSADATMFLMFLIFFFFVHENIQKLPSKVAHNRPNFFFSTGPAA
jgi:hypothetical protein